MWDDLGGVATALSVLVGAITWLIAHLRDRRRDKVAHTTQLISNLSTCEPLAEASYRVSGLINRGEPVAATGLAPETERHVVAILDYYEYICETCASGVVDYDTILSLRGGLMRRTWTICEPYIREVRRLQRRRVYSEFERFVADLPEEAAGQFERASENELCSTNIGH